MNELPETPASSQDPATLDESKWKELLTRRRVLMQMGAAAVASAAAGSLAKGDTSANSSASASSGSMPGKSDKLTNPNVTNGPILKENPDSYTPPKTDAGDVNSFKYPMGFGHNRISDGGWARQVTDRDLMQSKTLAGVNMRLERGAVRELHWHAAAEWSFMLTGTARITCLDQNGKMLVDDVGPGDLWYFPSGFPHSIQGVGDDGCEFLLVFDDGSFSEFDTFLITDWLIHTPKEVLAKNFNTSQETFKPMPDHELYIFRAPMPDSLEADKKAVMPEGPPPNPFVYNLSQKPDDVQTKGGSAKIADSSKFKVSKTVATALVTLKPGGLRELHWHPNADEWQFYVKGKGRMTVFTGGGKARTMDFEANDVGYIDVSLPHYIENTGDEDLVFLEMFKSSYYSSISLTEWMANLPAKLLEAHLHLDPKFVANLPNNQLTVVPSKELT